MNDKIARWILNGRFPKDLSAEERKAYGVFTYRNNKPVDDIDAVVLLPVLVEKGYWVELKHFNIHKWRLDMGDYSSAETLFGPKKPTIAEAITSAILKHIIGTDAESI